MSNATDADYQTPVGHEKTGAYAKESEGMSDSKGFTEYAIMSRQELVCLWDTLPFSYRLSRSQCRQVLSTAMKLIDERAKLATIMRELVNAVKARDTHVGNGEVPPAHSLCARRLSDAVARVEEAMP